MNRNSRFLLFACAALLFVSGCSKPYDKSTQGPPAPDPVSGSGPGSFPLVTGPSLNELFKDFRSTPETQCVTAGILQTVTFAKGTRLTFYPNSFKDAAGNIITSGLVCIQMVEMYKPGDMIANRTTTTTIKGELLESGGQVSINAIKDGKKVYANRYDIGFLQPAPSTKSMDLYYGSNANVDSVVKWEVFSESNGGNGTMSDSAISSSGWSPKFIFNDCTSFGLINCDMLHNTTAPRTQVTIILPDTSYNDKTLAIVVLHELNAAVFQSGRSVADHSLLIGDDLTPLNKVPLGLQATVVVMSRKNGEYYYYEQTGLTITNGMIVNAAPTKQTFDYIKTKLLAL